MQQAPGAFAQPGFSVGMITRPPKVGNGTRRLQKRGHLALVISENGSDDFGIYYLKTDQINRYNERS